MTTSDAGNEHYRNDQLAMLNFLMPVEILNLDTLKME